MRIRSKVEALERRASPTGECGCHENRSMDLLLCRDPSVPPPPLRVCGRCGRGVRRLILGPVEPGFRNPAAQGGARPYEPANADTIDAMMAPAAYEPADADTVRRMAYGGPA